MEKSRDVPVSFLEMYYCFKRRKWRVFEKMKEIKHGLGWMACYDDENEVYTARISWRGDAAYYEIDAEVFGRLSSDKGSDDPEELIKTGRLLYKKCDGSNGPATEIIYDDNFAELCSWAEIRRCDNTSSSEMTDLSVELLGNEKTKEHRMKQKKEKHHNENKD